MLKTGLDIVVASTNQLSSTKCSELRKLWVHGVQNDSHAVGWLPTGVFDARAKSNEVTAVYRENELVGWCLRGRSSARRVLKIYQIWVRPDARIIEHGRALITDLVTIAQRHKDTYLEAWVAEDLPANLFWHAIGFTRTVWRWGRGERLRKIWRWFKLAEDFPKPRIQLPEFCGVEAHDARNW